MQDKTIGVRCAQEKIQVGVLMVREGETVKLSPGECWKRYVPSTDRYRLPTSMPRTGTPLRCPHCQGQLQVVTAAKDYEHPSKGAGAGFEKISREQAIASIAHATQHDEVVRSHGEPDRADDCVDIVLGEIRIEA